MQTSFIAACLLVVGCASKPATPPPPAPVPVATNQTTSPTVSKEQAHALVEHGATLVDVRSPDEYAEGHILGAINLPVDQLPARAGELGAKTQPLVLYCRSGKRATLARNLLREAGFTKVENLGGMGNW